MQPMTTARALDDALKATTLSYASLSQQLYLNAELCDFLYQLEATAHKVNEGGMHETEAGTLLGFTSAYEGLRGLDINLREGASFDPKVFTGGLAFDLRKLPLGFKYQGTVHTHPRRAATDPMRSFSAIDMITVMLRSYQERVSIMVSDTEVHLILCCDDAQVRLPARESTRIVTKSLEDITSGMTGTMQLDQDDIVQLSMGSQTVGAIAGSAARLRLGYYTGTIGDVLTRRT
jgi:hypothetical protein